MVIRNMIFHDSSCCGRRPHCEVAEIVSLRNARPSRTGASLNARLTPDSMLASWVLVFVLAMSIVPGALSSQVYKCAIDGAVSYQGDPCPSNEARIHPTVEQLNAERKKALRQGESGAPNSHTTINARRQTRPPAATEPWSQAEMQRQKSAATRSEAQAAAADCDGRKYCSQMTSCAQAKYFLANCPGVRMDGDRNGIPCEKQWCNR